MGRKAIRKDRMIYLIKEIDVKVKTKFVSKIAKGYPLIAKEAIGNLNDLQEEGCLLRLVDENNRFLAKGYYGRQNKGYGWVLTHKEGENIDQEFFNQKIQAAYDYRKPFFKDTKLRHSASSMVREMELVG